MHKRRRKTKLTDTWLEKQEIHKMQHWRDEAKPCNLTELDTQQVINMPGRWKYFPGILI